MYTLAAQIRRQAKHKTRFPRFSTLLDRPSPEIFFVIYKIEVIIIFNVNDEYDDCWIPRWAHFQSDHFTLSTM